VQQTRQISATGSVCGSRPPALALGGEQRHNDEMASAVRQGVANFPGMLFADEHTAAGQGF
jgi:hypothetical protein